MIEESSIQRSAFSASRPDFAFYLPPRAES